MAAAAPLAIPALGAVAGAVMNKQNPLLGAALGGFGGYMAAPALGALGGAASAGAPGAMASVVPGLTAGGEQAAMLAAQNAGFGMGGLHATGLAGGGQGLGLLGSAMSDPSRMAMRGMQMMQPEQQQIPQMTSAPPRPQAPYMARSGSMADLGFGQPLYQPRGTRFYG